MEEKILRKKIADSLEDDLKIWLENIAHLGISTVRTRRPSCKTTYVDKVLKAILDKIKNDNP